MTAAVLRRGAAPPRRAVAKPRRPVPAPVALVRLPVTPQRFRRHVASGFLLVLAAAGIVTFILLDLPQRWWQASAQAASRAGFEVRHVEPHGIVHSSKFAVYQAAFDGPTNSMLLVDLDAVRARLRALPWVADASVTRRLPDTLRIDIVERKPFALWQYRQRLVAIDRTGTRLTDERLDRFARLPLVVGPDANRHAAALMALLADFPRIASALDAASFVGHRRWDIRFKTGETLVLPEGAAAARTALARFDALDRTDGLLAKGYARFDMRLPGQMTVRVAGPVKPPPPIVVPRAAKTVSA